MKLNKFKKAKPPPNILPPDAHKKHDPAAEICGVTSLPLEKVGSIIRINSPRFSGWACIKAATVLAGGGTLAEAKREALLHINRKAVPAKKKKSKLRIKRRT